MLYRLCSFASSFNPECIEKNNMLYFRQLTKHLLYFLKLFGIMFVTAKLLQMTNNTVPLKKITEEKDDCNLNLTVFKPCFNLSTPAIKHTADFNGFCPDTRCAVHACDIKAFGLYVNNAYKHVSLTVNGTMAFNVSDMPGMYITTVSVGCVFVEVHRFNNESDNNIVTHLRNVRRGTTLVGLRVGEYLHSSESLKALADIIGVNLYGVSNKGVLSFIGKAGFPVFSNVTWEKKKTLLNHTYKYYIGKEVIPSINKKSWDELFMLHQLEKGGNYRPPNCIPHYRIAIIIPFRNRYEHLRVLINNLVPFLKNQMLAFTIFIVDQKKPVLFNRAALMNIGYVEANKLSNYDCFIFHDVDLMPIDLCNSYYCTDIPRHLCVVNNKHNYNTTYAGHFGGANIMNDSQMKILNGFSNRFFGWGKEDDEMFARTNKVKLGFLQQPPIIGRYDMIRHQRDTNNPKPRAVDRNQAYKNAEYYDMDGLSSLYYHRISISFKQLYTHISVAIPGPSSVKELDQYKGRIGHKPNVEDLKFEKQEYMGLNKSQKHERGVSNFGS